jgi:acylphosphatase
MEFHGTSPRHCALPVGGTLVAVSDRQDPSHAVARRVVVRGRVQGVWFRESTREAAERAGVRGWVCNRPDGSVEAHLEGSPAGVDQVVAFMRAGPPRAAVQHLDEREAPAEQHRGFTVR